MAVASDIGELIEIRELIDRLTARLEAQEGKNTRREASNSAVSPGRHRWPRRGGGLCQNSSRQTVSLTAGTLTTVTGTYS
jgi:hypothetical protein